MTDQVEKLVLEHLQRFQAGQEQIEHKLEEMISRVRHLEGDVAGLRRAILRTPTKTQRA